MAGYAHTAGIASVAQNLTGTPSIVVDNVNGTGIVTFPGQAVRCVSTLTQQVICLLLQVGEVCSPMQTILRLHMFLVEPQWVVTMVGERYFTKIIMVTMRLLVSITASRFSGDGSTLTNLPSTDSIWRSNSTGIHTLTNVGLGTTNTEGYKLRVVGNLIYTD